ncbi:MAG TPA: glycosyltransferase, partial [Candidatus Lustribacter sp.]|nr:glycosyltransferase [Candidatus Lustribacter sp.]
MLTFTRTAAWVAAAAWIGMMVARGQFWDARADRLAEPATNGEDVPDVHVVVPARNEGDVIARTLTSVLAQRYPGRVGVTIVDDRSDDDTAAVARAVIARAGATGRASIQQARPRPDGWSGKVWAMSEGVESTLAAGARPAY